MPHTEIHPKKTICSHITAVDHSSSIILLVKQSSLHPHMPNYGRLATVYPHHERLQKIVKVAHSSIEKSREGSVMA